jgi:predicted membrane protein
LQDLQLLVPVSAAVPIGVAANVCDVSVLSLQDPAGPTACDATSNSMALSRALAVAMMDSGGGGSSNQQSGLVNVNVQDLQLLVPVSVAVPISVAANVCDVSILSLRETGRTTCDATSTSTALSNAIARAFMGQ